MAARWLGAGLPVLAFLYLVGGAHAADQRHDTRIDEAAAEIVAARMGPLRGGFGTNEQPMLNIVQPGEISGRQSAQVPPTRPAPGEWRNGLAIAVEKKSGVSTEL